MLNFGTNHSIFLLKELKQTRKKEAITIKKKRKQEQLLSKFGSVPGLYYLWESIKRGSTHEVLLKNELYQVG